MERSSFLNLIMNSKEEVDTDQEIPFGKYIKSLDKFKNESFDKNLQLLKELLIKIRLGFKSLENHPEVSLFVTGLCELKNGDDKKINELTKASFPNDCHWIFQEKGMYEGIVDSEPNNTYLWGLDEISQYLKLRNFNYFVNSIVMLMGAYIEGYHDSKTEDFRAWVENEFYDLIHF